MNARMWRRGLVAAVVATTIAGGTATAAADEGQLRTGDDPAHAAAQPGDVAAAGTMVPMPDLAIAHRLPGGGMNLWRMPLSELETGYGQPELVKTLNYGGFSYDNSRTIAGDFGDITPSDDGTADHIIWHAQPNGGVLLWAVGGGADTTPRLWQDLRTGGWSWANSRPAAADVNGDGWDDLVVLHRIAGTITDNVWVFLSDGQQFAAPRLWDRLGAYTGGRRFLLSDLDGDGYSNVISIDLMGPPWAQELDYSATDPKGGGAHPIWGGFQGTTELFTGNASAGWSFAASRQLVGDVTGDGWDDLVTVHQQPNGGILVWVHPNCGYGFACVQAPVVWQDLRSGGWSFAGSRQYLADTNGDGREDLISVHQQSGNPGELIWRHLSTGAGFSTPQVIADLRTGGWTYAASRDGVADLYGEI